MSFSTGGLSYARGMSTQSPISQAVSDILTGYYNRKRLTQEAVAKKAGMSIVTLQKKLKANAPITATDLVILSRAIGVDPSKVIEEAEAEVAEQEKLASVGVASISDQRQKKKSSAEMTDEELEGVPSAANTDPELGHDEPEAP